MTTKEKLTRLIIELIHGLPWEEAIKKEPDWCNDENDTCYHKPIITIGRVMAALKNIPQETRGASPMRWIKYIYSEYDQEIHKLEYMGLGSLLHEIIICNWKLLNDDGSECTLDSQSKETIEALCDLLIEE